MKVQITFHIDAGKYEPDGEKNYKYCDESDEFEDGFKMYAMAQGYEFVDFYFVVEMEGMKRTFYIDGGPMDEKRMRTSIANLWMQVTGNDFFSLTEGPTWEQQVEAVEKKLSQYRDNARFDGAAIKAARTRIRKLAAENRMCHAYSNELRQRIEFLEQVEFDNRVVIKQLSASLDQCREEAKKLRPMPWQEIHTQFKAGLLTWTEAFDALMSQCGMPMEEALKCLAEHFDRRPVIQETEVAA